MSSKTMLKIGHSLANRTKRHKYEAKVVGVGGKWKSGWPEDWRARFMWELLLCRHMGL